ncbi:MAG: DUF2062 domain-containing protein [Bacteroidetes bacterium]|nr:DUF2062 domain-containing protein [Bacteroidota bacterium]
MLPEPSLQLLFKDLKACVLLPTYNNASSLAAVLEDVLAYTRNIIVVNDGSTDATKEILRRFPAVTLIDYTPNQGKGYALRQGLKAAATAGYTYAIAMDSDGQHFASDLAIFLKEIQITPGILLVGARNMTVDNVPQKSNFGNRFSNFWYWVNTGIQLPDTQSGYRLYPLEKLATKWYFTKKYEFEIEVLVRASWSGIPVRSVPVSVYYPPAAERVSHFRPFKDFTRISLLNTVLVLVALLYIKPRDFFRLMGSKAGWLTIWNKVIAVPGESNLRKASSVGFGVFMGIVPVWGFQLLIGIPLALMMRLNKGLFLIAANISIFPIIAFWLFASVVVGNFLLGQPLLPPAFADLTVEKMQQNGLAFFLGGAVLALVMGCLAFSLCYGLLRLFRKGDGQKL